MYSARLRERVGREGFVIRVVGVRGYRYPAVCIAYDHGRVVKVARRKPELYYIPDFQFFKRRFLCEGTQTLVIDQKVIQIFDARPGRRSVVYRAVVPAESRSKVHYPRAGVNALRGKVCAVAADVLKVIIFGVASERPLSRVRRGCLSVIIYNFHKIMIFG